jgi:FkbM family methyltransferase
VYLKRLLRPVIRQLDDRTPALAEVLRWRRAARGGAVVQILVDKLVRPGNVVLDIGANRGLFTARLLQLVGDTGEVHAFEPYPLHVQRLRKMAARQRNLYVHAVALSDRVGEGQLMVPLVDGRRYEGMGSLEDPRMKLGSEAETINVALARLDDIVRGRRVDFMKCDVEGHEGFVFKAAEQVLARQPVILVEIEQRHRGADPRVLINQLERRGLRGWAVFGDGLRPAAEFDLERDQLRFLAGATGEEMPAGYVHNFLFTPPDIEVTPLLAGVM